jgi:hypothetical protein
MRELEDVRVSDVRVSKERLQEPNRDGMDVSAWSRSLVHQVAGGLVGVVGRASFRAGSSGPPHHYGKNGAGQVTRAGRGRMYGAGQIAESPESVVK